MFSQDFEKHLEGNKFLAKYLFQQFLEMKIWVSSSLSPTIPTILTTRRSLPLSASRRTKRMLSQKERVGTEGLAW